MELERSGFFNESDLIDVDNVDDLLDTNIGDDLPNRLDDLPNTVNETESESDLDLDEHIDDHKLDNLSPIDFSDNVNQYVPISFGLPTKNLNWKLLSFISRRTLSSLDLLDDQIIAFAPILDWSILSSRALSGRVFVKCKKFINWKIFLLNGKPKEVKYLRFVKSYLVENANIFFSKKGKLEYYTDEFISMFPNLVDFDWLIKRPISSSQLLEYWDKFNRTDIAKYQTITPRIAVEKKYSIDWLIASTKPMSPKVLDIAYDFVSWPAICQYQTLNDHYLNKYIDYLNWDIISQWQKLSIDFITAHMNKLNMYLVSRWQYLDIDFIKTWKKRLFIEQLALNPNYNTSTGIQVFKNANHWYIIEPPDIGEIPDVNILTISLSYD